MAHEHKVKIEDVATEGKERVLHYFYSFSFIISLQICLYLFQTTVKNFMEVTRMKFLGTQTT